MIKSMTAYGRGEVEALGQKWVVELRSLNHRFLDLSLNLPKRLWALEDRVRKIIKGRLFRGRVEMQLTWEALGEQPRTLKLDPNLVREVRAILQELREVGGNHEEPLRLDHFLHFADVVITREGETLEAEQTWEAFSPALEQALGALEDMRRTEGAALAADLAGHLKAIRRDMEAIQAKAPLLPELWREKVTTRLAELSPDVAVEEARLAQEVALMAERRDLSEELARLESHVSQFHQSLNAPGPVGRKQEFLLQEMLREINTIGSKAGDLTIAQSVLDVKGVLERLREQVQNIE